MNVFISWSGSRSGLVAAALRDWLQDVIQALEPWMSEADIEKGARWSSEISAELERSNFGIICLTRDNLDAPWLLFEAGALSKLQHSARVCTFLLDVKPNEVRQPMAQFQATSANRDDVFRLIETINTACGETRLEPSKLKRAFDRTWNDLNEKLKAVGKNPPQKAKKVDPEVTLAEILAYVRSLSREESEASSPLTTDEIVLLGKIFTTNEYLNIAGISKSRIALEDGTHGTHYKVNRRSLAKFLRKMKTQAREEKIAIKK